ncbi:MAG: M23 family metallopeptidase [Bacteroidaceae bacterium]|nr:M23 family metallopeptidase [Bacteroidaceae bacterium]
MKKVYYQYDPKTKVYRRVHPTFLQHARATVLNILTVILIMGGSYVLFAVLSHTPQMGELLKENADLKAQFRVLSHKVDDAILVLQDIEQRDDNLYRVLLEADPVPEQARQSAYNSPSRYAELLEMPNAELLVNTAQKIDLLNQRLYMQSRSFNEVVEMSREQEQRLACIPAIQPVSNMDLKRTASGYGYRIDPIYHVTRFHKGMDFACDTGTPVYATGNGTVRYAKWQSGFGNLIEIDHGFGYVTRYAHLSKILVTKGQKVYRGAEIGRVGSTGKSTGPHLHYEVIVQGNNVNPINYYFMDLDAEQYEEMISLAENHGKVFD